MLNKGTIYFVFTTERTERKSESGYREEQGEKKKK